MTPSPDETSRVSKEETPRRWRTVRVGSVMALLVGVACSTGLIVYQDFSSVVAAANRIGWEFALVLVTQVSGLAINGLAWRALFRLERPGFTTTLLVLRWIRESINYLLPVGRLGGDMAAVPLLVARGRDVNTVVASVVVDKTLEVLGLLLFSLAGIFLLFEYAGNDRVEFWAIRALGLLLILLVAFLAAQRWGLLKLVDKVVSKFSGADNGMYGGNLTSIHETVWAMYTDAPRIIVSALLHAIAWVPGALQIWLGLHFMGFGIGLTEAFIIESLTMIVCSVAFMMPAALGAQEAAYMTIGWWLFGVPPAAGLALSLVMRMKDVIFGVPGLVAWQGFQGRHLWMLLRRRKK